ncbi:isoleucyl-tRNA synthetase [Syncephalastrum racemosum]|uniref:Isoleucine--tRNA ligase, mitochondrial n=1 Tax=Syncephalastrum racemosum TaxID=13706 RepID=A0A1X2GZY2_SYNRA|nr:isoleucyl-tRNA synthetase [Syncephalastrum racemosum]
MWRSRVPLARLQPCRALTTTSAAVAKKNPYSETLLLPKTPFPLRADAVNREHQFRDRCMKDLYEWQLAKNPGDKFILHDGPPYANGDVHSGHAMNKILKDIINRYKVLRGRKVMYRPGWDCHGLPIELKALEQIRKKGTELSAKEVRQLARARALSEIEKQKQSFKSWAVMGDWDRPYRTLDRDYEIRQLRVFRDMMKRGYIYRQLKPVYWSPSSQSALAESELEYNEQHVSRSIHVRFRIQKLSGALETKWKDFKDKLHAVIWTTTPWTLPANRAVAVHPDLEYVAAELVGENAGFYLIAKDRLEAFQAETGSDTVRVLDTVLGRDLVGTTYAHPLTQQDMPILGGGHVTADSGTGLVHSAPGHGMEDYELCQPHGIEPFSPVDNDGKFTTEAGEFAGLFAFTEGTSAVIDALTERGALVLQNDYVHKYPYDWRTKKPVMLRSTAQWFANVEGLQKEAVQALQSVKMVPEASVRRLEQFTLSRKEWCISRQRAWGVPIPALYDAETGEALLTDANVEHIINIFETRGTDVWWEEADDAMFVAPEYRNNGRTYHRGYDTMDVWFDSGTSWTMLDKREGRPVADIYLEGSDQHRGWFQSSLLTSIATTGKVPYETLITHGFALDEQGRKMSKSIGNVIVPSLVTHGGKDKKKWPAYGTDVLRMWVANCEYTRDVSIGSTILAQISETMRKLRTTARFLLGNLSDFHASDCVSYADLKEVDQYMLHELHGFGQKVTECYDEFAFNRAMHHIQHFTTNTLSAFYFDVIKDRLYNDKADAASRRTAQTVLYHVLSAYTKALAPVACHTAEEIYEHYRALTEEPASSVFKTGWVAVDDAWRQPALETKWQKLIWLKTEVNQVLEVARQDKAVRSSLEAEIELAPDAAMNEFLKDVPTAELASLFLTSRVTVHASGSVSGPFEREAEGCRIVARPSARHKCPRCWNYHADEADTLCGRCQSVLS